MENNTEIPFDFSTPILKDTTLLAKWGNPSLTELKEAFDNDTFQTLYPVGTEFDDTYKGEPNPWILVDSTKYQVTLQRKYCSDVGTMWNTDATDTDLTFENSSIREFLATEYVEGCTEECLGVASDYYGDVEGNFAGMKFTLPSAKNCNAGTASGTSSSKDKVFAYYADQADTGTEGAAGCEKRTKTDYEGNKRAWWTSNSLVDGTNMRAGGFRNDGTYYAPLVTSTGRSICPIMKLQKGAAWDPENPTIEGLRAALDSGNTDDIEIGTEIPDEWDGENNPLIVGTKQVMLGPDGYYNAIGLTRKYLTSASTYAYGSSPDYPTSTIFAYLNGDYLEKCSDALKDNLLEASVKWFDGSIMHNVPGKVHLFSGWELMGLYSSGEGSPWELWKQRTKLSSPTDSTNSGRIMYTSAGTQAEWWARSWRSANAAINVGNYGDTGNSNTTAKKGIVPEFWIGASSPIAELTLANLKASLENGNAQEAFPVGAEIPGTWNGSSRNWIVGHYGTATLSNGETREGVYLLSNVLDPGSMVWSGGSNDYASSSIHAYLQDEFLNLCDDDLKNNPKLHHHH